MTDTDKTPNIPDFSAKPPIFPSPMFPPDNPTGSNPPEVKTDLANPVHDPAMTQRITDLKRQNEELAKSERAESLMHSAKTAHPDEKLLKDPHIHENKPKLTHQQLRDKLHTNRLHEHKLTNEEKFGMIKLALKDKGMDTKQYDDAIKEIDEIIHN